MEQKKYSSSGFIFFVLCFYLQVFAHSQMSTWKSRDRVKAHTGLWETGKFSFAKKSTFEQPSPLDLCFSSLWNKHGSQVSLPPSCHKSLNSTPDCCCSSGLCSHYDSSTCDSCNSSNGFISSIDSSVPREDKSPNHHSPGQYSCDPAATVKRKRAGRRELQWQHNLYTSEPLCGDRPSICVSIFSTLHLHTSSSLIHSLKGTDLKG